MKKVGFIDYYLDEWHANNYPAWIQAASGGELEVTHAWAEIDSPKGGLTTAAWCEKNGIEQVSSEEALIEACDYLVVLSPDNPERHMDLCRQPLASGKRVYVDKTFATGRAEAELIFENAKRHQTPCFSSSALRFASEYAGVNRETIQSLSSWGPGPLDIYSIHQIEPIVLLMGPDARGVFYTGTREWPSVVVEFADGRRASWSHHGEGCPFAMAIDHVDGSADVFTIESDYFQLFIAEMVDFFQTGTEKVPHDQTIAVMAIREAALRAARTPGIWITV